MKNRIKKFLKDNQTQLTYYMGGAIVGMVVYTLVCDGFGYKMVAPMYNENGELFFKDVRGNVFTTKIVEK